MRWDATARRQHGAISRRQLSRADVSDARLVTLVEQRLLVRAAQGVYLVAGAPATYDSALWVAVLATGGTLGFSAASHVWSMLDEPAGRITVLLPQNCRATAPAGVRIRRRSAVIPVVERWGLPVTDQATSVLDHVTTLPDRLAITFLDRSLQRGWLTLAGIQQRLDTPMWGNRRLRRLSIGLSTDAVSEFERRFHRLLRQAGMHGWRPNFEVDSGGRVVAVIDVAFPEQRLAIELDGRAYHVDPVAFQRDRSRQNKLLGLGWRVLRFTWEDLLMRPKQIVAAIRCELARGA